MIFVIYQVHISGLNYWVNEYLYVEQRDAAEVCDATGANLSVAVGYTLLHKNE